MEYDSKIVHIDGGPEQFRSALSELFVEVEVQFLNPDVVANADVQRLRMGEFEYLRTRANLGNLAVARTDSLIASSRFNSFFVCCVLGGYAEFEQGDRIRLDEGDIAVLDSTAAYRVSVPAYLDAIWIRVPRYRLDGRMPSSLQVTSRYVKGDHGLGAIASKMILGVMEEARSIDHSIEFRLSNSILDILALALLHAPSQSSGARVGLLERLQLTIEQNLGNPDLSLKTLAARHGITVRYLNKLFAQEGISTARWIRMRRLERCRDQIESPDYRNKSISSIALDNGFNDISNFNRNFRAYFGVTPRSLRQI